MKLSTRILTIPSFVAIAVSAHAAGLTAHEWGTFTTLRSPGGQSIPWYQKFGTQDPAGADRVSELPSFVKSNQIGVRKAQMNSIARMETPVIYFYTTEKQTIEVQVGYPDGEVTEFFPGSDAGFRSWPAIEITPVAQAQQLLELLPGDPELPDSHYFEARAVPDAAVVRHSPPVDKNGHQPPDQFEKFLFYRGAGAFDPGLEVSMPSAGTVQIANRNPDHALPHSWVLQSSPGEVRWEKLPPLPKENPEEWGPPLSFKISELASHDSRAAAISALEESMVGALAGSGLTPAEADAMVATWNQQWYDEPGQRVFSIVPRAIIDECLPLAITPEPDETVRVFVHRTEVVAPDTFQQLELAMAPHTAREEAKQLIADAGLGRFIYGTLDAIAANVGFRTQMAYQLRGRQALETADESTTASR